MTIRQISRMLRFALVSMLVISVGCNRDKTDEDTVDDTGWCQFQSCASSCQRKTYCVYERSFQACVDDGCCNYWDDWEDCASAACVEECPPEETESTDGYGARK